MLSKFTSSDRWQYSVIHYMPNYGLVATNGIQLACKKQDISEYANSEGYAVENGFNTDFWQYMLRNKMETVIRSAKKQIELPTLTKKPLKRDKLTYTINETRGIEHKYLWELQQFLGKSACHFMTIDEIYSVNDNGDFVITMLLIV